MAPKLHKYLVKNGELSLNKSNIKSHTYLRTLSSSKIQKINLPVSSSSANGQED